MLSRFFLSSVLFCLYYPQPSTPPSFFVGFSQSFILRHFFGPNLVVFFLFWGFEQFGILEILNYTFVWTLRWIWVCRYGFKFRFGLKAHPDTKLVPKRYFIKKFWNYKKTLNWFFTWYFIVLLVNKRTTRVELKFKWELLRFVLSRVPLRFMRMYRMGLSRVLWGLWFMR